MKADAYDPQAVVGAVRTALGGRHIAMLHGAAHLSREERDWLAELIGLEPVGYAHIIGFELAVARRLGVKHAIAVSSGTAALHLALLGIGIGEGSNVYVPALTFAAAAAAVRYVGARPWFYPHTGDHYPVQPDAMIDVDLLGIPSGNSVSDKWPTVHDAAQALGSSAHGRSRGNPDMTEDEDYAEVCTGVSILSFNNNKIVTTGGGGMVLTNNDAIAERVRFLATTAKTPSPHHYVHTEVGFNYRMPNVCAALGLMMLDKLDDMLAKKARLHEAYVQAFADVPGVSVIEAPAGATWNHWLNAIEVPPESRDGTLQALTAAGYECRALFTPLPQLEPYRQFAEGQTFPEAERRFAVTVCLPSGPELAS